MAGFEPGNVFTCTTDKYTVTNASNAACFFVSAGSKSIWLFDFEVWYSNANGIQHQARLINADLVLATSLANNIQSMVRGASPPNASGQVSITHTISTTSIPAASYSGTYSIPLAAPITGQNGTLVSIVTSVSPLFIPAGQTGGIALYMGNTAAGTSSLRWQWAED